MKLSYCFIGAGQTNMTSRNTRLSVSKMFKLDILKTNNLICLENVLCVFPGEQEVI